MNTEPGRSKPLGAWNAALPVEEIDVALREGLPAGAVVVTARTLGVGVLFIRDDHRDQRRLVRSLLAPLPRSARSTARRAMREPRSLPDPVPTTARLLKVFPFVVKFPPMSAPS